MVNYSGAPLDAVFGALADPTRRDLLEMLGRAEARVTDLARSFSMSLPGVSKHLRVLEQAGLVIRRREGRTHFLRLETARLQEASDWIERYRRFWESRFEALAEHLAKHPEMPKKNHASKPAASKTNP